MSVESKRTAWSLAGLWLLSGCLELREQATTKESNPCAACHGSITNAEEPLLQSAPPSDLKGNTSVSYPGVGAHALHLFGGSGYAAVACDACHQVPSDIREPGHLDSNPPAEVELRKPGSSSADGSGAQAGYYDVGARRCVESYCHGSTSGVWTKPRSSRQACGSCHGLPPAPPHPQSPACETCHSEVIGAGHQWIAPELHVNGRVEVDAVGCTACHGSGEDPAPPRSLGGAVSREARGVGAHQAHLQARLGRALACEECHRVPDQPYAPGHLDGSGVDVLLTGVATQGGARPVWDSGSQTCVDSWCHNPPSRAMGVPAGVSPIWVETGPLSCDGCHASPPPAPHPQVLTCGACHGSAARFGEMEISDPERHVDGTVDVTVPEACDACHGTAGRAAPPNDLRGRTQRSVPGVGAHRAHLEGRGLARVLQCEECHRVPQQVSDPGHLDLDRTDPAEVTLVGVAQAFGAEPRYEEGTCSQTYCHGDSFIGGRPSGGEYVQPRWTWVEEEGLSCTSCHGMPPPEPHPQLDVADCSACHRNADGANGFTHPERHVDGIVTFYLNRGDQLTE